MLISFFFLCLQIWRQLFSPLHCLNFGVGGDATQHVLWRLSNGELDNISPKVETTIYQVSFIIYHYLSSIKYSKHAHACLCTQKTDYAQLCAKTQISGPSVLKYQWHVVSVCFLSFFVAVGRSAVGRNKQSWSHTWTDLWWNHGYSSTHSQQAPQCSHACTCMLFSLFLLFFKGSVASTNQHVGWKGQVKFMQPSNHRVISLLLVASCLFGVRFNRRLQTLLKCNNKNMHKDLTNHI